MAKITFEDKNAFAGQPFNQLKAAEVNEIKASVNALYDGVAGYLVVTELPATIPQGVQLLYNGTMYRGLLEGESSLAAGTPWPVKGYKEWSGFAQNRDDSGVINLAVFKNDIGGGVWSRTREGVYLLTFAGSGMTNENTSVNNVYFSTITKVGADENIQITSYDPTAFGTTEAELIADFYLRIFQYPPAP